MKEENKISTPMAIVLAGFLIMIGLFVSKNPVEKNNNFNNQKVNAEYSLDPINETDHIRGDIKNAKVVIVEYSDTECPFCKNMHNIMLKAMNDYGTDIAWVYRHFPLDSLHQKARTESEATECVAKLGGEDAFWQYLDMIFETTNSNDSLDLNLLPQMAKQVGVDVDSFNKCLSNKEMAKKVQDDQDGGIRAGARGTPYSIAITNDGTQIPISGADANALYQILDTYIK